MKILFLARLFYPHIGGVEKHVLEVSKELIRKGHDVTVITELFDNTLKKTEFFEKIRIIRIPVTEINKKYIIWHWLWKNRYLLEEADIIHAHDVAFWYFPFRFISLGKKFYTTFHGYEGKFPISKKAIVTRKLSEYISSRTIAVGEFIKKWYGANPDEVVYGGVSESQKSKVKSQKLSSTLRIVYVGRMDKDMGVSLYVQVLKKLVEKKVQFEFVGVGDGELKYMLDSFGKTTGFVNDINPYIEKADVVFASSYLTILESLSMHKKVVAVYTNPLKKDYLTMTPFAKYICVSQSSDDIINYIQLKNSVDKKVANLIAELTWEKLAETYINLWKK